MSRLKFMYLTWLNMLCTGSYSPLANVHWISREFGYTYQQSKHLERMFRKRWITGE